MKDKAWIKTLLEIYRHLELIANTIDEMAQEEVQRSFSSTYRTTMDSVETLMELNERKRKIINIKVIIENAIVKLKNPIDQKILILYYFDGLKSAEVTELLHLSTRTFFRRKNNALVELLSIMEKSSYTLSWWLKEYKDEKWLMGQYQANIEKDTEFDELQKLYLLKNFRQELKTI